jgi:pimeloyl-ACP methyl ester carboxylesterase
LKAELSAGGQIAETARGPFEYASLGPTDGPAVLMSHGTPGGYDQGLVLAEMLGCEGLRFIAVSRAGYLRTPLDVGPTPVDQADAYAALLDTLGIERAAIFGISGGGPSAIQFAARHRDRCWALVLISAITRRRLASERPPVWRVLHWVLGSSDLTGWIFAGLVRALTPATSGQAREKRIVQTRRFALSAVPASLRRAGHANDSKQFGLLPESPPDGITCPTLIIHGTADGPVPVTHAQSAAASIPNAELVTIPGEGHGVFSRRPELAVKVAEFLMRHSHVS